MSQNELDLIEKTVNDVISDYVTYINTEQSRIVLESLGFEVKNSLISVLNIE